MVDLRDQAESSLGQQAPAALPATDPVNRSGSTSTPLGATEQVPGSRRLTRHGIPRLVLAADVAAVAGAALIVRGIDPWGWVFGLVLVALFATARLYRPRLSLAILDDLPRIVGRWLAALAVTVLGMAMQSQLRWGQEVIDWIIVLEALVVLVLVVVLRSAAYAVVRRMRSRGVVAHRTVIVGAGLIGAQVADTLLAHPEYGLKPVGFVDPTPLVTPDRVALPVLGSEKELQDVLLDEDVRIVVVAFGGIREPDVVDVIRTCGRLSCEIFVVPRLFEVSHVEGDMDTVWGLPLVRLRRNAHRTPAWRLKRAIDAVTAALALVLLSPVMLVVAAAVRSEGGPGVLFRQTRVGVDGQRFELLKFRSLKPVDESESATNWNIAHDDRLGPVGRVLRRSSIDELPQLINILRGDMSFVGPRPERPHFVQEFASMYPRYGARHRVPSGLTGLAQVNGLRGDTSIAERARFDNLYIENWSLWLDLKVVLRTFRSVVRAEGG